MPTDLDDLLNTYDEQHPYVPPNPLADAILVKALGPYIVAFIFTQFEDDSPIEDVQVFDIKMNRVDNRYVEELFCVRYYEELVAAGTKVGIELFDKEVFEMRLQWYKEHYPELVDESL